MARILISPPARRDLKSISDYIANQSNNERARKVLRAIAEKLQVYASQPNTGRTRDELREGLRSFAIYGYVVFYIPIKDGIDVKRVIHGSRDLEAQNYSDDEPQP